MIEVNGSDYRNKIHKIIIEECLNNDKSKA